jgi:DNA helicase IV
VRVAHARIGPVQARIESQSGRGGRILGTADVQREMALEQANLTRLYEVLDAERELAAHALERVRQAPLVPTPGGRTEREAFDNLHSERLWQLAGVEDRLAFGRLDLIGGERRYIGRIGLSDDEQTQLLVDWRAPAASAFYQATGAAPDGVARRRHLATRNRRITGIDDDVLDPAALESGAVTITGDGALMAALTAHRTGRMRDIVATLQAEQDTVVRAPLDGVLVVQGGPGTGKTAVALHRAAYLLYTHRNRIARSGVLVVGPSPVFLRYIEQVLPALGETGVLLATPAELVPGVQAVGAEPPEVAALKGDARMAAVLREAVRQHQRVFPAPVRLRLDDRSSRALPPRFLDRAVPDDGLDGNGMDGWDGDGRDGEGRDSEGRDGEGAAETVTLHPHVVAEGRARARRTGRAHNDARVTFVKHVLDDLTHRVARSRRLTLDEETRADLAAELRSSPDVRREVNLRWMPLTATGTLERLLGSPEQLAAAADGILTPAEQRLLRREVGAARTPADVPLLDELTALIGEEPLAARQRALEAARAAYERAEALQYAQEVLSNSGQVAAMMTPEMLADRFAEAAPDRTLTERAQADPGWAFGHAVVDEAQELSAMAWRMIARRVPSRSITVVGDIAQTGSAGGLASWSAVRQVLRPAHWRVAELTVNYRTPAEVMALATRTARAAGLRVTPPRSARQGEWPPAAIRAPDDGAEPAEAVLDRLREDDAALGGGRFAVITATERRPQLAADLARLMAGEVGLAERVDVHTPASVKGLEFDAVVVVDPAAILAASPRGANDLYVALTRCTQRLAVLHHGDLPAGLDELAAGGPAPGDDEPHA